MLTLRPDLIEAYINRAEVLLELNKTKEAMDLYSQALKQDSENADVYYNVSYVKSRFRFGFELFFVVGCSSILQSIMCYVVLFNAILIALKSK